MLTDEHYIILPNDKSLCYTIDDMFGIELTLSGGKIQARRGNVIVNSHYYIHEALVLNDDGNIIDGFCRTPLPYLPWKGIQFLEHLRILNRLEKEDIPEYYEYTNNEKIYSSEEWMEHEYSDIDLASLEYNYE